MQKELEANINSLNFRISKAEKEKYQMVANSVGLTLSSYLRLSAAKTARLLKKSDEII